MTKHLIAAVLAAVTLTAQARDLAWTANNAEGRIVIQSYKCPWDNTGTLKQLYMTAKGGQTEHGCWYFEKSSTSIHAIWADGTRYTYDARGFTFFDDVK